MPALQAVDNVTASPVSSLFAMLLIVCQNSSTTTTNASRISNSSSQWDSAQMETDWLSKDPAEGDETSEHSGDIHLNWSQSLISDLNDTVDDPSSGWAPLADGNWSATLLPPNDQNSSSRDQEQLDEEERLWLLHMQRIHKFHMIKAIVLVSVVVLILLSTCKMVFKLFVQFSTDKQDKL